MTDTAYDRPSALLEPAPDLTEGAYDRLRAAREREDYHRLTIEGAYRDVMTCAAYATQSASAVDDWAARLATAVGRYCAEVKAKQVASDDANRALREMSPLIATRPDEATS